MTSRKTPGRGSMKNVEGIHPLSPVQQGMLFHSLAAPESGVYVNQFTCILKGDLRVEHFRSAWEELLQQHSILRAAILWEGLKQPVQAIRRHVRLPWQEHDWRGLEPREEEERLEELCRAERRRGFDLAKAPVMRFHLIGLAGERYRFLWTHHHIVLDGWSLALVLRGFFMTYQALCRGQRPARERPRPFSEYLAWLKKQSPEAAEVFWGERLRGVTAPTLLDGGLAPATTEAGLQKERRSELTSATTAALEALGRRHRLTLNTLVLGAWALVLSRYVREAEVVFGVTVSGRPIDLPGAEAMIGLFINTLPVRVEVPGPEPVFRWLQRLQEQQVELRQYEHCSLTQVQGWSEVPRGVPLFESIFVFENYPAVTPGAAAQDGLEILDSHAVESTNYPLNVMAAPGPRLRLWTIYDAGRFSDAAIGRLLGHVAQVLAGMATRSEARVADLTLLTPAEHRRIVEEWNDNAVPPGTARTLPALFEARVDERGDHVAVRFEGATLGYRELDERANQLARHLRGLGVGPESRVGLGVERGLDMMVALLGILKAGGAYLPLDPSHPAERLAYMLEDGAVSVLVIREGQTAIPREGRRVVLIDADGPVIARQSPRGLASRLAPDNLAYVIYTSGSTGRPKGVQVPHGAAVNFLTSMHERPGLGATDRLAAVTTLGFDISVLELLGPLTVGAQVEVIRREVAADAERLAARLSEATVAQATPATWRLLSAHGWPGQPGLKILCGGEALSRELADALIPRCAALWNMYGPTETTVWSTCRRMELGRGPVSIGRPIANTEVYLLDRGFHPVPVGVAGELLIGGLGVTRGYLGRPGLTAARFIPDPWSGRAGARLYVTGDLARYQDDGGLVFQQRVDLQVKIRGFRIELGEIESVLVEHPAVRQVVVVVRRDRSGEDRLVAYWVARGEAPSAGELRRHLQEKLPDYMVPALFVSLEALPLTPAGKIDRRGLPEPDQARPDLKQPFAAPRGDTERAVAALWARHLGLDEIGIHDNFFELGGHSLIVIQLIGQIRKTLEVDLPFNSLLERPTVAELARHVDELRGGAGTGEPPAPELPALEPAPELLHEPFPLTDLQEAYWVGSSGSFELGNLSPHLYLEYELAELDPARLQRTFDRLIARHPMLRALVLGDGRQQILEHHPPYRIRLFDLREHDDAERDAALGELRQRLARQGPRADEWPLFELHVSRLGESRFRIHFSVSLLICDAFSVRLLLDEVFVLYRSLTTPLESLELSYRDYVVALDKLRQSEIYRRSAVYWRERLASLPPAPELPLVRAPQSLGKHHLARLSGSLDAAAWQRLKSRAQRFGLTPSAVLCAVYASVLATWSKASRFTLNVLFSNRLPLHPQVYRLVGNCSTTLLLEVAAAPGESFQRRAERLQKQLWSDLEHCHFTGIQALRELNRMQEGGARAAMPIVFTSALDLGRGPAGASEPVAGAGDLEARLVASAVQTPQVWLDHQVGESAGVLGFNWDAVDEIFPAGLVDEMFAAYQHLLRRLADADASWHEPPPTLVPASQLARWAEANDTAAPVPPGLLHGAFAERLEEHLHEPAVITPERVLTYGELARASQAVGSRLRELGAQPNELVAVVMEKGWEQVVATLGVLWSGAAYLPIDASLPGERLRYLLEHGQVEILLTQPWLEERLEWPDSVRRLTVAPTEPPDAEPDLGSWRRPVQRADDLAYVIFTSGSTGLPKGVMIDHRGALNTVADVNQRFAVGPADRVLALSALNFDLSVYDVFGPLAAGGAIVMPAATAAREPAHWLEVMERHQVTLWNSVPALMEMLVDSLESRDQRLPESLRLVLMSGDWIPVTLADRLRARAPEKVRVISLGGATEASIWSILYPIETVDPDWPSIPYGRAMVNQSFFVLDDALELRPAWVPGQLYIGGVGVAKGYWRDPKKTAASFVVHPRGGERLYRTGDLGRYLPDGNIEFLGREDFQVKIQGYRIELGEIEAALLQHPAVRAGVATAVGPARGPRRLVAYVVPESGEGVRSEELGAFLAKRLPEYMIPTAFVTLAELPLSANGKVDRSALPAPEARSARAAEDSPAPSGETEKRLIRMWEEILDTRPIGVRDNFFDLGGHSLLAVRLMGRIRRDTGLDLPLAVLFEKPTVEHLAAALERGETTHGALVAISPGGSKPPFFCVHPVGGSVLCYAGLARRLGPDRPFYGFATPRPTAAARRGVEDLAALYVAEMRQVAPTGPYLLGGWSMGGVVAFEMARQLEESGQPVALAALIDAAPPRGDGAGAKMSDGDLAAWFVGDLAALAGKEPPADRSFQELAGTPLLRSVLTQARRLRILPDEVDLIQLTGLFDVFKANARALASYVPKPCAAPVILFRAAEGLTGSDPGRAWSAFARGKLETRVVPGDHYSLMSEPGVADLAAALERCLEDADGD